jgi:acetyltransferase
MAEPMDIHGLNRFFDPQRIALIGVTINPNSVGGRVLANLIGGGFRGVVYPVNPEAEAVLGVSCFPDLASLPRLPDLAVICAPAARVPELVAECGRVGILGLIIMSSGFGETGDQGLALEDLVRAEVRRFPGMRIIGPNCLGVIVPGSKLNVSFASGMPPEGRVAFISQSGALCTSVLDWALEGKVGFSHLVSIGNTLDVGFADLIDYFGEDEKVESIILYIESITRARRFMTAARAFARSKPIIAFKAGRFPESSRAASSHTGALATEDAVYDAAFRRAGLARVFDIGEVFDIAELIHRQKMPQGPRLAIVTNAGGPGVIATDALVEAQGSLASFTAGTAAELRAGIPGSGSTANPVDVLGDAPPKRVEKAVDIVLRDPGVDAVLVILTPQAMTHPTSTARVVAKLAAKTTKPILAAWLGGASMREGTEILDESGVAAFLTPEQAIRAFMTLVAYGRNLKALYETPKDVPVEFRLDREEFRRKFLESHGRGPAVLPEDVSKSLIAHYGLPVARTIPAASPEEAAGAAREIGYPVVLKVRSPGISHKSAAGGVALNLENEAMVRAAYDSILAAALRYAPGARLEGVTVQPMVKGTDGLELILGIQKDPVFGTVILAGMGGLAVELLGERTLGLPPLNERLARMMLSSLRIWPLLQGYRGRPALNVDRLIEIMIRLSYLAADYPEIAELDINPLLVTPREAVALDARVVLDPEAVGRPAEPYSHLALRPYPEAYVRPVALKDGTRVLFRPIKPEDEPLWLEMLASCSKETIYSRFRYFFHWQSHEAATRFCYIDYDREMAIVAEITEAGRRRLLGVGRLIADPDHENVEYAVLIIDAWQNKELGSLLTGYCLEIARHWRLKRVVAQTTAENRPMLAVFEKFGFAVSHHPGDSTVDVVKELE